MNTNEASAEIAERVRKYRFKNPHMDYQEAEKTVRDDDPELAAANAGADSPRTSNIKRQFELDRKLKEGPGDPAADITKYQYRVTMAEAMGWRQASKIYGIDIEREIKEKIQREIMDLVTKQILYQKTIANYPKEEKRQVEIIKDLQSKLGLDIGYTPEVKEIQKEQNKLIALGRKLAEAEEALPKVEAELSELRTKLAGIESGKKFSRQRRFESPSAELAGCAQKYSREHKTDYTDAVNEVMKSDPVLATAYNLYDIDTLLGLND